MLSAVAYATITANNIRCVDPGYLSLSVFYGCAKDCPRKPTKNFSDIKISAKSPFGEYNLYFENPPDYLNESRYELVSIGDLLDHHAGYTLTLDDGEYIKKYNVICPNTDYLCKKIDLTIDLCAKDDKYFYYLFSGLANQFSEDELKEEIDYYVNPSNTYLGSVTLASKEMGMRPIKSENLPESSELKNAGSDKYILKVPIRDLKNREMEGIYIEILGCDKSIHNSAALKRCEERSCDLDEECPIGAYCEDKVCKILECSSCEEIQGHNCVSTCKSEDPCEKAECKDNECHYTKKQDCCLKDEECGDNDICTEDTCKNNKCEHPIIKCKDSDDPCVIGTCKTNQGCVYTSNPECFMDFDDESTKIDIQDAVMGNTGIIVARIVIVVLLIAFITSLFKKKRPKKKRKK
jgi:hypothetical protein